MKKLLLAILAIGTVTVYAEQKVVYCDEDVLNQVKINHEKIDTAFEKGDACSIGRLLIENHKIIGNNIECFPNHKKGQFHIFQVMDDVDDNMFENANDKCSDSQTQVMVNHQKIKLALTKGDACKAGKLEIEDHNVIKNNLTCFPTHQKNINYTEDQR